MLTYKVAVDAVRQGVVEVKGSDLTVEKIAEHTALWPGGGDESHPCLDLDSLDLLELVVFLEGSVGVEIGEERIDAEGWRTVGDVAAVLVSISKEAIRHEANR
jgi:hypothetical protein